MRRADWHNFQVLTKRHERLAEIAPELDWAPNIWMGVSIENGLHGAKCATPDQSSQTHSILQCSS